MKISSSISAPFAERPAAPKTVPAAPRRHTHTGDGPKSPLPTQPADPAIPALPPPLVLIGIRTNDPVPKLVNPKAGPVAEIPIAAKPVGIKPVDLSA